MAEASGVSAEALKIKITELLNASHVEIEDMSGGCGQAFSAVIVSPQFEKKTTLARHRLVNGALKAEIAAIHAWTPKCYTPETMGESRKRTARRQLRQERTLPGRLWMGQPLEREKESEFWRRMDLYHSFWGDDSNRTGRGTGLTGTMGNGEEEL
ncbi:uncharacterized protein EAF02_010851 [Botrytis sinoallii]|uniref:uncharacterized protein n=1 Tax=Botrytis sinoallii TaxID=1463999 RepID=UPI0018FFDB58|nr:uncharacterized protein EAF02_010851 [Botrytis sinoallii]KAF7860617.1 hypothetical protein EAF02_010851 [Botrytis sinoallii]